MPNSLSEKNQVVADEKKIAQLSRRRFLGYAGAATGLMAVAAACSPDKAMPGMRTDAGVSLGSGDIGILNYAYALEQLEAAFYTQVMMSKYSGMNASETALITDVRDHEIAHREFFKKALGSAAIGAIEVNFEKIDFGSRDSVLNTAKAFEDLGVSAYNGAGRLIVSADYLVLAGKIVSVEARHAAYFRDLIMNGSFADSTVVDAMGLDVARKPMEVLAIASAYLKTPIDASQLPTY
ncbi:MAG: ferritin-like domain-containing protein [Chitinophagaceae bacterium]